MYVLDSIFSCRGSNTEYKVSIVSNVNKNRRIRANNIPLSQSKKSSSFIKMFLPSHCEDIV